MNFLKQDVRNQIIWILSALVIIAAAFDTNMLALVTVITSVAAAGVTDLVLNHFIVKADYFPKTAVISGLLIGLIIDPGAPFSLFLVIPVLTMAGKHVLRVLKISDKHIFNPAAAGVTLAGLLYGESASWWGVSAVSSISSFILMIGVGYVLWRLKRIWIPIVFLFLYFLILIYFNKDLSSSFNLLFDGTVFLFAFVMLPEPETTPAKNYWKFVFPVLTALIVFFAIKIPLKFNGAVLDPLLVSLLIADLCAFIILFPTEKKFRLSK